MSHKFTRRHFLRGAGGAILAIPYLPSLTSRAWAADAPMKPPNKCFFSVGTGHGNIWSKNMYPSDALLTDSMDYAGRTVRFGNLAAQQNQGMTSLSPCLSSASGNLPPSLLAKMNVMRGLDIPYRIGHHDGGYLGNFAGTLENNTGGINNDKQAAPTIDQFLAFSPTFYSQEDIDAKMTQRSFCIGSGAMSWNYTSPIKKLGDVVSQPAFTSNLALYNMLFDPGSAYNGVDAMIIDRVKENLARLKKDPRLSKNDHLRLDQHVERMFEIERKIQVAGKLPDPPSAPMEPTSPLLLDESFAQNPFLNTSYVSLMNDMVVAAFTTGVSRIGTWRQMIRFSGPLLINDWHGNVGHEGFGKQTAQQWALSYNRGTFEHVFLNLASKLDQVSVEDGSTLLDNSLVTYLQEAGQVTHQTGVVNLPVVTIGGAGGDFKTGQFVDYADSTKTYDDLNELITDNPLVVQESPGLYYQQFLATVLQAFGAQPQEYETFTDFNTGEPTKGYGFHYVAPKWSADYSQAKLAMGEKLPVVS